MLGTAKPLASLTASLLARKGEARPAMRRPAATLAPLPPTVDDLGWNDMGEEPLPPVLEERQLLALAVAPEPPEPPKPVAPPESVAPMPMARKAAFTLRLDADRHLKLRLAAVTGGRSAQAVVTEALDAFIATLPDVAALHAQLSPASPRGK